MNSKLRNACIARNMGMTVAELREWRVREIRRLRDMRLINAAIARWMGLNRRTVQRLGKVELDA
jgi:hypothetical protein